MSAYGPGGAGSLGGNTGTVGSKIEAWVQAHYTATTIGNYTVYNLTGG